MPNDLKIAGVVLAAGVGSRLKPITDTIPKPLLPLAGRPLLGLLADQLERAGVAEIFVNLHAHAQQIADYLDKRESGVPLTHRVEERLTGPAGALATFAEELRQFDVILVISGDVVVDTPLHELLRRHIAQSADLTFGVVETRSASRYGVLRIDADGRVTGAREKPAVPDHEVHPISAGVYCLAPSVIDLIATNVGATKDLDYAKHLAPWLLSAGRRIAAYPLPGYWRDIGTLDSLRQANLDALAGRVAGVHPGPAGDTVYVADSAQLGRNVRLRGCVVVGPHARVGNDVTLMDTVLLPGAQVCDGSLVMGGMVAATA